MIARMLGQVPLPLLPAGVAEIVPSVGLLTRDDCGLGIVHELATFAWDADDKARRRPPRCNWSGCGQRLTPRPAQPSPKAATPAPISSCVTR